MSGGAANVADDCVRVGFPQRQPPGIHRARCDDSKGHRRRLDQRSAGGRGVAVTVAVSYPDTDSIAIAIAIAIAVAVAEPIYDSKPAGSGHSHRWRSA